MDQLIQSVRDGTAPLPPSPDPDTQQMTDAYNACFTSFTTTIAGIAQDLSQDTSLMCAPMKVFVKCSWKAYGVDFKGNGTITEGQKAQVQKMMDDQLSSSDIQCDFTIDSLISEMKDESNAASTSIVRSNLGNLLSLFSLVFIGRGVFI